MKETTVLRSLPRMLAGLALAIAAAGTLAQSYPTRPLKLVVPYPAGASTDTMGRLVAGKLAESMGQPVVVENRAGASGNIGSDFVAKSAPDGYTLVLGTDATHGTNAHLRKDFPYHPVRDFAAITAAAANIIVLVTHPGGPPSLAALLEQAKNAPGKFAYGSSGAGSPHHLAGELLRQLGGVQLVHVPYKGGAPAVQDLLGAQIPLVFASLVTVAPLVKAGKLRALGVVESRRYPGLPDVPAIGETVAGFELSSWLGFFAPAGVPAPIVARLNQEIVKALNAPDVKPKLESGGLLVIGSKPEEFAEMVRLDFEKRGKLLREAGIGPE